MRVQRVRCTYPSVAAQLASSRQVLHPVGVGSPPATAPAPAATASAAPVLRLVGATTVAANLRRTVPSSPTGLASTSTAKPAASTATTPAATVRHLTQGGLTGCAGGTPGCRRPRLLPPPLLLRRVCAPPASFYAPLGCPMKAGKAVATRLLAGALGQLVWVWDEDERLWYQGTCMRRWTDAEVRGRAIRRRSGETRLRLPLLLRSAETASSRSTPHASPLRVRGRTTRRSTSRTVTMGASALLSCACSTTRTGA